MSPRRVAWVIKGLARGGAERLVTTMAPRLAARGFDTEILYLLPDADGFVPELRDAGVPVRCISEGSLRDPRWTLRLRNSLRTGRFDLIHTHSPLPAVAARLVTRRNTPMVHTEHNMWDAYRWPTFAANAMTLARNGVVYAVSDSALASMQRPWWTSIGHAPEPQVLLHGVDPTQAHRGPDARRDARRRLGIAEGVPLIGHVANLSPKKDQATLLNAFADLRSRRPDTQLVVVGMGPLREHLEEQVRRQGTSDQVHFLGSRDDVPELLPAFDVFALSSSFEGLPIALLEAMAAQVPCVTTAVGGIPEVIRDGIEGRLVAPGDHVALTQNLLELLDDPAQRRRIGMAGRDRVADSFSIDNAVEVTCAAYERLLRSEPS